MVPIPNLYPFKMEILKEAEVKKAEAKLLKEERKKKLKNGEIEKNTINERQLKSLDLVQKNFEMKREEILKMADSSNEMICGRADQSTVKAYARKIYDVIRGADVLIEVLDARDPIGSRCKELEKSITETYGKRLILLLNKIDLVPVNVTESWLSYLRKEFPTLAFKASTQHQNSHLCESKIKLNKAKNSLNSSSNAFGVSHIFQLLANYSRINSTTASDLSSSSKSDLRTSITVGVLGYPNVGKSSVINSLKRQKVCTSGSMPGLTKTLKKIKIDRCISLIDTPGIILSKNECEEKHLALKNAININSMSDWMSSVEIIMQKMGKPQLILTYNISDFETTDEFLTLVAFKSGKLKKGGIPDKNFACKLILNDWNNGKLKHFVLPPLKEDADAGMHLDENEGVESASDVKLVEEMLAPLQALQELYDQEGKSLTHRKDVSFTNTTSDLDSLSVDPLPLSSTSTAAQQSQLLSYIINPTLLKKRKKKKSKSIRRSKLHSRMRAADLALQTCQKVHKKTKKVVKKLKKNTKRNDKLLSGLMKKTL